MRNLKQIYHSKEAFFKAYPDPKCHQRQIWRLFKKYIRSCCILRIEPSEQVIDGMFKMISELEVSK